MDLKLHRPQPMCSRTGSGFRPGDVFFSALVRGDRGLERIDVAAGAWEGPPPAAIAWWRSVCPMAHEAGPTLAPAEVLLDALEALEEADADPAVCYLLALQLVRRRALKLEGPDETCVDGTLVFSSRRRDRDYRIRPVEAESLADPEVGARLTALLWSGEAA
jgi:hypothetical protein